MVSFLGTQGTSANILRGSSLWGLAALYVWSRKGALNPLDMSRLRACVWTSSSVFMLGTTWGGMFNMEWEKKRLADASQNMITATRVAQNEQQHAVLRNMKFHLMTRQMGIFDQDPR